MTAAVSSSAKSRKPTIEPLVIVFFYGVFLNGPVMQQFVYQVVSDMKGFHNTQVEKTGCDHGQVLNNTSYNVTDHDELRREVQSLSSLIQLLITLCSNIPGIIVALFLGSWTDRIGRRPVLGLPPLGHSIESVVVLLVMYLKLPIYVLFAGSFISGICGTLPTFTTGILAYVTDITEERTRPLRMAILEAMILIGGCISYATSGIWIKFQGFIPPYWLVFTSGIASVLYIVFLLPESHVYKDTGNMVQKPSCLLDLKRTFGVFAIKRKEGYGYLIALVFCDTIQTICSLGISAVLILLVLDTPFCMSSVVVGIFMAFRMLMIAIGAVLGIRVLGKCVSLPVVAMIALLSMMAASLLTAFATTFWMMFLTPVVGLFQGASGPIIKTLMSKTVGKDQEGALFAAVVTIENIGSVIAALVFNSLYAWSQRKLHFHGFVFLISGGLLLIPIILLVYIMFKVNKYGILTSTTDDSFLLKSSDNGNEKLVEMVTSC